MPTTILTFKPRRVQVNNKGALIFTLPVDFCRSQQLQKGSEVSAELTSEGTLILRRLTKEEA